MTKERKVVVVFWACVAGGLLWYVRDTLFAIFLLSVCFFVPPHKGEVIDSWQSVDRPQAIRIDVHQERCGGFLPGVIVCFWSRPDASSPWSLIMERRNDDPIPPPSNQVRLVTDTMAYCYFATTFASTTDGGTTWHAWEARERLPHDSDVVTGGIDAVNIASDGQGVMMIEQHGPKGLWHLRLTTADFGATWAVGPATTPN